MNITTNLLFTFCFILLVLFCKIINIDDKNYILHKLIIFVLLFIYQYVILLISKFKDNCQMIYKEIFKQSMETAIVGIIGYSIYNDLVYMEISGVSDIADDKLKYIYIAIIITLLLMFVNSIELLLGFTPYKCIKNKKKIKKNNNLNNNNSSK